MRGLKKPKLAFTAAVVFLLIAASASGIAISRLTAGLRWIAHTYDVEVALGDLSATMGVAGRARSNFDAGGDASNGEKFEATAALIPEKLARLKKLVSDNPSQIDAVEGLKDAEDQRLSVLRAAVERRKRGPVDPDAQIETQHQLVALGAQADAVTQEMLANEERLLVSRRAASSAWFAATLWILSAAFAVSLALFYVYYRMLATELTERERAEKLARESQKAARQLSARLLHLQDEERRKFSRELHDSLGQYLAAAKMSLDAMAYRSGAEGSDELLNGARSYLEQSMTETRTISYLLHPPLLDETGLGVAARWYVEGFSQRSGIQVNSEIPEEFPRLPRDVELALFRVLQECLTNIHRHSKSGRADVTLRCSPSEAYLRVRDYGGGIAAETLRQFRDSGTNVGVGLSGMSERVRDQGGVLDIQSNHSGVTVVVTMPLADDPAEIARPAPGAIPSNVRP
jgi:signal transduction histidine kinase